MRLVPCVISFWNKLHHINLQEKVSPLGSTQLGRLRHTRVQSIALDLVELALKAERDLENAGVFVFFSCVRPSGDRGNWDKHRDDFHCM